MVKSTYGDRGLKNPKGEFMDMQEIIDSLRGELDKKHGQDPGWSGPATYAYMRGYGEHPRQAEINESAIYRDGHCNHGWYT